MTSSPLSCPPARWAQKRGGGYRVRDPSLARAQERGHGGGGGGYRNEYRNEYRNDYSRNPGRGRGYGRPGDYQLAVRPSFPKPTGADDSQHPAVPRRIVDYNGTIVNALDATHYWSGEPSYSAMQPTPAGSLGLLPASSYRHCPASSFSTKFVHVSTNKIRCSVNNALWTPGGRRLLTGCQSGEFTLWNGMSFNFETIIQAHDKPVRGMTFSNNDTWLLTGDDGGIIQYWTTTLNKAKRLYDAHRESVRGISFSPTDLKFASCSDDTTVKVWDFAQGKVEHQMSTHGGDVKAVEWHQTKSLLASGSKDSLVKLWDPQAGREIATIHGHKNTVSCLQWHANGNWLLTGGRDQVLKLFDLRTLRELETYRGQNKDVTNVKWHPVHRDLFVSSGMDGSVMFWQANTNTPLAAIKGAHEYAIWGLAWHPMGHVLATSSQDNTTKFWARNRPGDMVREKGGGFQMGDRFEPAPQFHKAPAPTAGGARGGRQVIPGL